MAWRDQLQPASFRGVGFEYRSDDLSGVGRRNQALEYPKREKGYVEDMGRSTERIDMEAILIGADYLAALENLLKALRTPGPGELVHPFYGRLQMVAEPNCRVRHSFEDGGMCAVSLSFVEAGENKYPQGKSVPSIKVLGVADKVESVATAKFTDLFKVDGLPEWVSESALSDVERVAGSLQSLYRRSETVSWASLLGDSGGLASRLLSIFSSASDSLAGLRAAKSLSEQPRAIASAVPSSAAQAQVETNRSAVLELATQGAIAQAARDVVAVEEPVYDDLQSWRTELTTVVDREVERPGLSQDSFEALADVRAEVGRYVLSESATASRLTTYTPPTTLPAVVLAYDLYEDAARSDELVARNGVRHPGFVPPDPLKVLSA